MLAIYQGAKLSNNNPFAPNNEPMTPDMQRLWAIAIHALGVVLEFFAPLLGYLLLKDRGPFIRHHVTESLNFGITMLLLYVVLAITIIGWAFFWVPPIIWTVFRIIAAYKASLGEYYRYPVSIRLVRS
ncbi:MAG: DUF4870 domain-containing protein [Actinobacteria bacterium]|nr:DUF4870 domain-containing protein [Actinomycetota bacterium]